MSVATFPGSLLPPFPVGQHRIQSAPVYRHVHCRVPRATSSLAPLSEPPDLMRVGRLERFMAVGSLRFADEFCAVLHCLLVCCQYVIDTDFRCPEGVTMNFGC